MKCSASVLAIVLLLFCYVPPTIPEGYMSSLCREDLALKIIRVCGKKSWRALRPRLHDLSQVRGENGNSDEMYVSNVQKMLNNGETLRLQPHNGQQILYNGNKQHKPVLNDVRDYIPKLKKDSGIQLARARKITPKQFRNDSFKILKQCCTDHCNFEKLLSEMC